MDQIRIEAKTVEEAVAQALLDLDTVKDKLEYEVVEEGSDGFLGIFGQKKAVILARKIVSREDRVRDFLTSLLTAMDLPADVKLNQTEEALEIEISGDDMGILIGKRGQTLDSLQYLVSLVANKGEEEYVRVKLDTENYRERRKETLEHLAKNLAGKAKRLREEVKLEPMNPYERRIIHSYLQSDPYVETRSEGEEPYRYIVISVKKDAPLYQERRRPYRSGGYRRDYRA